MFTLELKRYLAKMIVFGIGLVFIGGWILNAKNQLNLYFGFEDLDSVWSTILAFVIASVAFTFGSVILFGLYYLISALFNITFIEEDNPLFEFNKSYQFLFLLGDNLLRSKRRDETITKIISPIATLVFICYLIPGNVLINNYKGIIIKPNDRMSLSYSDLYLEPSNEAIYLSDGKDGGTMQRFLFKSAGQFTGYKSEYEERPGLSQYILAIPMYLMESIIFTLLFWGLPFIIILRIMEFKRNTTSSNRQDR